MAQTAKRNLTQPQPTPCARPPRSSPRHESPAIRPKTRPFHEGETASHKDIHEAQLHPASTGVTDQVHDPRYRHERRTISRGKAGGRKPPISRIMSDIGVEEGEPNFRAAKRHGWIGRAPIARTPRRSLLNSPGDAEEPTSPAAPEQEEHAARPRVRPLHRATSTASHRERDTAASARRSRSRREQAAARPGVGQQRRYARTSSGADEAVGACSRSCRPAPANPSHAARTPQRAERQSATPTSRC